MPNVSVSYPTDKVPYLSERVSFNKEVSESFSVPSEKEYHFSVDLFGQETIQMVFEFYEDDSGSIIIDSKRSRFSTAEQMYGAIKSLSVVLSCDTVTTIPTDGFTPGVIGWNGTQTLYWDDGEHTPISPQEMTLREIFGPLFWANLDVSYSGDLGKYYGCAHTTKNGHPQYIYGFAEFILWIAKIDDEKPDVLKLPVPQEEFLLSTFEEVLSDGGELIESTNELQSKLFAWTV